MSSRMWATIIVMVLVVVLFAADIGYTAWRNHLVETIPIGASESDVLATMGTPDSRGSGSFGFGNDCSADSKCYEWSIHQNYQYVCFGADGRVSCRGTYTIWV
jgi:hypothetical protein